MVKKEQSVIFKDFDSTSFILSLFPLQLGQYILFNIYSLYKNHQSCCFLEEIVYSS